MVGFERCFLCRVKANMKIFVTGASGFIGRHLCKYLSDKDHEVIALVRTQGTLIEGAKRVVVADFSALDSLGDILKECGAVIHLAGRAHIMNDTAEDPLYEFRRVNVGMTEELMRQAARAGVRRFIYASSIGVNGNKNSGHSFVETDIESPHDLYAVSKLEAEQLIKKIAAQTGMEYVIVRPALVFGPDAPGNFGLLLKFAARRLPLPVGSLSARRSLLSVWNLASFLELCINHRNVLHETFLIADNETVTLADIFKSLGVGMRKAQIILPVPQVLLVAACYLFGKKRQFDKLNSELRIDSGKAAKKLNWKAPYTTAEGLIKTGEEYIYWIQNEKNF